MPKRSRNSTAECEDQPTRRAVRSLPRIKQVRAYCIDPPPSQSKAISEQGPVCCTDIAHGMEGDKGSANPHEMLNKHWINGYPVPIANPMSVYPQYSASRVAWGSNALGSLIVEVEAEDGTVGVGVSIGGEPGCYIVEKHLSRFIEGEDPTNIELMWDQMWRATVNYGRKGLPVQCISAVDLALWDLLGHLRGQPVYALLGGKVVSRLPVYMTSSNPLNAKKMGFVGGKIPLPYGPKAGDEGFRKNVEFFKSWREKVGPAYPLMLDCYMALTVPYAIKLARALKPYGLKWLEESLMPDDYEGYAQLKAALEMEGVMLSTGEHEYTRYGFQKLLESRCVDILQPDITWIGGITEARRVVAMASAHDILVIPHGSSVYSYHLQYAFPNCPMSEFLNLAPNSDFIMPYFGGLFPDEPLPRKGFIDLPNKPGFGVTLRRDGLRRPYVRSDLESAAQAAANKSKPDTTKAIMPF